jgi:DNA-binding response OmpR family regulator
MDIDPRPYDLRPVTPVGQLSGKVTLGTAQNSLPHVALRPMNDDKTRILVVEDQPEMRKLLRALLSRKGYEVHLAADAESGLRMLDEIDPHLVMLDVRLPEMDGLSFCKLARVDHDLPILMVSGLGDALDRVQGLEMGADDYLPKPFHEGELMARVDALLRRSGRHSLKGVGQVPLVQGASPVEGEAASKEVLICGPLQIDLRSHQVHLGGQALNLTLLEFKLLEVLMRDAGRVFTRERLLDLVWGNEFVASERLVDTHIKHLRRKLAVAQRGYEPIMSVRGVGYRFQP